MRALLTFALFAAAAAPAAQAAPLVDLFTLTYDGQTITYELKASPTPSVYTSNENFFMKTTATLADGTTVADTVGFYTSATGGGLYDSYLKIDSFTGQYFSGLVSAPTFVTGTYDFTNPGGVLTIAPVKAASPSLSPTPEPSSLLLLGTGILALAGAARGRVLKAV